MKSLLLILIVSALVNSQAARTLTEVDGYNRKPQKAPPPPISAPPSGVVIPLLASNVQHGASTPPPPKSATPVIELITTGLSQNYGRKGRLPPPAPKVAPPTHQVSGGGVAALLSSV